MVDHISGKVIMITGAAGGFGRLVAEKTLARGAQVVAVDVEVEHPLSAVPGDDDVQIVAMESQQG